MIVFDSGGLFLSTPRSLEEAQTPFSKLEGRYLHLPHVMKGEKAGWPVSRDGPKGTIRGTAHHPVCAYRSECTRKDATQTINNACG